MDFGEQMLFSMLLDHAHNPTVDSWRAVTLSYHRVAATVPAESRLRVVKAIAQTIHGTEQEVQAFLPILDADDDPNVIATAALDYSLLCPLVGHDEMTGVKNVINMVQRGGRFYGWGWRAGAVLGGAVCHGDRRVPQLLEGTWTLLDDDGKWGVTRGGRPGWLNTGTIEFYMRWLEDPVEMELGRPAAVLALLPTIARFDGIVRELERRLPADYHASDADRNQQVRVIREWSIPDYGRTIMPRLEAVWEREGRPEPMLVVMQAWS